MQHELYMKRCLQLAKLGAGSVAPNPMVGAVLVYQDRIIGEGYHQQYGEAHGEVNCINSVALVDVHLISESVLYVSLEPCAHTGKTPPCTNLILKYKITKVVIGCKDIFAAVNGLGIELLQQQGVEIVVGILQQECLLLNKRFNTFHSRKRPYIILKWAQSADEKIAHADFSAIAISNSYSNRLVHKWRSEEAAILVGTNTTWFDNPSLTTRFWPGKNPIRIIIDAHLKTPSHYNVLNGEVKTIVYNAIQHYEGGKVTYIKIDFNQDIIPQILTSLFLLGIQSVLVEGGPTLHQSFINANLWDEARVITNTQMFLQNGIQAPQIAFDGNDDAYNVEGDKISFHSNSNK
jgi:diaminohydroxyphosphoribosylaminopyrimidine deaminase / 5-amino-6-(5-phosphoribosylamino)uracil reductase